MASFLVNQNVDVGDIVTVIGKDEFKGLIGTVTRFLKTQLVFFNAKQSQKHTTGDKVYIIELHANNKKIERGQPQLKKVFKSA